MQECGEDGEDLSKGQGQVRDASLCYPVPVPLITGTEPSL